MATTNHCQISGSSRNKPVVNFQAQRIPLPIHFSKRPSSVCRHQYPLPIFTCAARA